jgi:hypothetical protein
MSFHHLLLLSFFVSVQNLSSYFGSKLIKNKFYHKILYGMLCIFEFLFGISFPYTIPHAEDNAAIEHFFALTYKFYHFKHDDLHGESGSFLWNCYMVDSSFSRGSIFLVWRHWSPTRSQNLSMMHAATTATIGKNSQRRNQIFRT